MRPCLFKVRSAFLVGRKRSADNQRLLEAPKCSTAFALGGTQVGPISSRILLKGHQYYDFDDRCQEPYGLSLDVYEKAEYHVCLDTYTL